MPKLFFTPTSCGAASFIAAHKSKLIGTKIHAYAVDLRSHTVISGDKKGEDFYKFNPKGNVPTIVLDDGTVLNENAATLQWIADQTTDLAPAIGSSARYLLQAKLSYASSELHATVGGLFNPTLSADVKEYLHQKYKTKLEFLNKELEGKDYWVGNSFTVADSYLFIILSWSGYLQVDLAPYPNVKNFVDRIANLDFVKAAQADMATYK
jgi:glutathione S-transferase